MGNLVLTRRVGDSIILFDDRSQTEIIVTVVKTQRGQTDIAITAPRHVVIERGEIREGRSDDE